MARCRGKQGEKKMATIREFANSIWRFRETVRGYIRDNVKKVMLLQMPGHPVLDPTAHFTASWYPGNVAYQILHLDEGDDVSDNATRITDGEMNQNEYALVLTGYWDWIDHPELLDLLESFLETFEYHIDRVDNENTGYWYFVFVIKEGGCGCYHNRKTIRESLGIK